MLAATHDGLRDQGVQGHVQAPVRLVAGVLRQQPKPLPLAAILGDDGYLPKALDAVLYVLERPTTIDLCPDFLCQRFDLLR